MPHDFEELREILHSLPEGPVNDKSTVELLLAGAWKRLRGAKEAGMTPAKLPGRTEDMYWKAPILSFRIERHGGTVVGSTRAELQTWSIDLESRNARIANVGHRQLRPTAERIDLNSIANQVAQRILTGETSGELAWRDPEKTAVRVVMSSVLPIAQFKRTAHSRRRSLKTKLTALLSPHGWQPVFNPGNQLVFKKTSSP